MPEWERAYWGANIERLRQIKAAYDPDNVFNYEQSITA
jgi:FAD/FMN-containing dehydrogenase